MNTNIPTIEELLKAGVHFGHQSKRWNPLMEKYIYGAEKKTHIIDVYQTQEAMKRACEFLQDVAASKKPILIVGTKRQARATVNGVAKETGCLYVIERWLGGIFTNFNNVSKNIKELENLIESRKEGKLEKYTKKEKLLIDRKIEKLEKFYGGLRGLTKEVGAMIVIDVKKEHNAISEAKAMGIPVVGLVDTNSDPSLIDFVIPTNDDAIKAIELILNAFKQAILRGQKEPGVVENKVEKQVEKEKVVEKAKPKTKRVKKVKQE